MKSDTLRLMAPELSEMVRKLPKLDWTQRETVVADLRRAVRRLLAMDGYPPELSEDATHLVLKQAELSTEAGACITRGCAYSVGTMRARLTRPKAGAHGRDRTKAEYVAGAVVAQPRRAGKLSSH
jgi:hypothetical protein